MAVVVENSRISAPQVPQPCDERFINAEANVPSPLLLLPLCQKLLPILFRQSP
jgi:hypothetical protein